ncbi:MULTISPECIES: RcnB family protein [unclassified Rhizobium]|jgi:Ni/Co efflux regulator RcnB|uniref:RcnB family protein n=1 Tax=unclassified Rhizobium TaxID=2613769 RepID=UPI00037E9209|nr:MULTISPECIES: RcnB family protein [unclassified Rhizobium]MBD9445234.1 RcnB family protein [Rhizobium sp. RHZ01]MBD9452947.1 RcnB family protein [Rhizobium sp. RHZ02]NMN69124.1 Ni/Co efflux regulator RcnB [Rhizobium sp. 57MFTsu3.2]
MKKLTTVLLATAVLASPLLATTEASAQDHRRPVVVERDVHVTKYKWSRGHRMTPTERRHMRDVRDYHRYRLSAPPRGYRWVQVDNDFLLIGSVNGVIANIVIR